VKLHLTELKVLVRSLLEQGEESTLHRWGTGSKDAVEVALAHIGIFPIPSGERGNSTVGSGSYNTVKEVLYKDRHCVARYSVEQNEQKAMIDFVDFARMMDPKYAKHFPELIDTFETEVQFHEGLSMIYGTLMELLDPMPAALEHDLQYTKYEWKLPPGRIDMFLQDFDAQESIIASASRMGSISDDQIRKVYTGVVVPILEKAAAEKLTLMALKSLLDRALTNMRGIGSYLENEITQAIRREIVPMTLGRKSLAGKHPSRKVREFVEFLHALDEAGMMWDDLHTGNFMVRRATGDFVVVDPGLFE